MKKHPSIRPSFMWLAAAFAIVVSAIESEATTIDSINITRGSQPVFSQGGQLWSGDDFGGAAGEPLNPSIYSLFAFNSTGNAVMDGAGHLVVTGSRLDVTCPGFDAQGVPLPVGGSTAIINFSAPQNKYDGCSIIFGDNTPPVADYVFLGVGNLTGQPFVYFGDEAHDNSIDNVLTYLPLDTSYTSIGLKLVVSEAGVSTPYYWLNSPAGMLSSDSAEWVRVGSAVSQFDATDLNHQAGGFNHSTITPAPVPEPSTFASLLGMIALCSVLAIKRRLRP